MNIKNISKDEWKKIFAALNEAATCDGMTLEEYIDEVKDDPVKLAQRVHDAIELFGDKSGAQI